MLRDFDKREAAPFGEFGKALPALRVGEFDRIHEVREGFLFGVREATLRLQSQQRVAFLPRFRGNRGMVIPIHPLNDVNIVP